MKSDNCSHGHGFFRRELSHIRDHWFSCALFCVVTHGLFHLLELVAERFL